MKLLGALILSLFIGHLWATSALAVVDPPLFSCITSVGSVISQQNQGVHGIPGDQTTHTGSDVVYSVDPNHVLQCFCPENGDTGIQSNWWKITDLSQEDQDFFIRRGWVLIPNGQPWGLDSAPYLVQNSVFTCQHGGTGGNGGNGGGGSSSSSSGDSGSSSSNSGVGGATSNGGAILGAATLADTGTQKTIFWYIALAMIFGYATYRAAKT